MANNSYSKVPSSRKSEWQWYTEPITCRLFEHIDQSANYADGYWKGIQVLKGQYLTSISKLALETGLSEQNVRTALKKLESTGDITCESTNKYRLITICSIYSYYGIENTTNKQPNKQPNKQLTSNQQATNKHYNIIEEIKEKEEEREKEIVSLTDDIKDEFEGFCEHVVSKPVFHSLCTDHRLSFEQYKTLRGSYSKKDIWNAVNYINMQSEEENLKAVKHNGTQFALIKDKLDHRGITPERQSNKEAV